MKEFAKVFFWGMLISFLGSLPLGTMNIAATHISIKQGTNAGLLYALGSMMVEIAFVRVALMGMAWITGKKKIFRVLEFFTTALLFLMAAGSFIAAYKMSGFSNAIPLSSANPFWTGALLSATNPLHIPFWMGWSTILINKEILQPVPAQYNFYISGIGLGTILGFMLFIYGGNYFVSQITDHQDILNWIIGGILFITGLIQLKKILVQPAELRYGKVRV